MSKDESIAVRLLRWASHIQAIARTGLSFTVNLHDRLRYHDLQEIAIEMLASINGSLTYDVEFAEELAQTLRREAQSGVLGYVTPKVSVAAAVFDQSDRILLVQNTHSKGGRCQADGQRKNGRRLKMLKEKYLRKQVWLSDLVSY